MACLCIGSAYEQCDKYAKNRHEIHIWTENRENTTILFFEDHGEGIQFYVYCYNNQPKVEINYQTGESKEIASSSENEPNDSEKRNLYRK